MTKTEELNIKIAELIMESQYWDCGGNEDLAFLGLGKQILQACAEADMVFRVRGEALPFPLVTRRTNDPRYQDGAIQQGMRMMLEARYRKIENIEL